MRVDGAVLGRYEADKTVTVLAVSAEAGAQVALPVDKNFSTEGHNVGRLVLSTGRPARIDDYTKATGRDQVRRFREAGVRSAVGAPVQLRERVWGVLSVYSMQARLPPDAEGRLADFAALVASAIANVQAWSELEASRVRIITAADEARRRVERDLHDGAQQMLMMIQIKLALAREAAGSDDASVKLGEIEVDAAAAVEELRVLAHGIYPTVLRERGLSDALRSSTTGSPVHVAIVDHGVGRCSSEIEAAVYFCSLEAIQNAVKHAGPDARVTVTLGRRATGISFEIADDGTGFEPGEHDEGMGLVSMRDRIGAVGGELEVQSRPGGGTAVYGFVPAP